MFLNSQVRLSLVPIFFKQIFIFKRNQYRIKGKTMNALETLIEEHEIIMMAIDVLDKSVKRLQDGNELPSGFFPNMLDIIKNFADKCHHGKEEAVLFPMISKKSELDSRIVSSMLEEHEKGRAFIKAVNEAVGKNDKESIIKNANGYIKLLPPHIKKENVVFPKWINPLSDRMKEELFEKFEKIEEEVIGLGMHEEYIKRIENLKNSLV